MDEDDETVYAKGPGKHQRGRAPVVTAYVDTEALDYVCPKDKGGCGAAVGDFCTHPDGSFRMIACPVRPPHRSDPESEGADR
jgi:hypothetical protein